MWVLRDDLVEVGGELLSKKKPRYRGRFVTISRDNSLEGCDARDLLQIRKRCLSFIYYATFARIVR